MAPSPQEMAEVACRRRSLGQGFQEGFEEGVLAERSRPPPAEPAQEWGPMPERYRDPEPSPLAQAMIAIVERCYFGEWPKAFAGDLWAQAHAGSEVMIGCGQWWITPEEIANLRALAAASGCWCDWSEAEGRPVDVPLGEWLGRFWNVKGGAR